MTVHKLRTDQPLYDEIDRRRKSYEARLNDRHYQPDDTLILQERNPHTGRLTGRECTRIITATLNRIDRFWPLSEIERHGLTILTLHIPDSYEASSLNPHLAAAAGQPGSRLPAARVSAAIDLLRYHFSLAHAELSELDRESAYGRIAREILTLP